MSTLRALSCPDCGGAVAPPVGSRRTRCKFCSSLFFYTGEDFLPRLALPSRLDEEGLRNACKALFKNPWVPRDLHARALLLQRHRAYLPFYYLTGKRGGVLSAGLERISPLAHIPSVLDRMAARSGDPDVSAMVAHSRPEVIVEEDSRVILGDFQYLYPAVSLKEWNFSDTDLKEAVFEALDTAEPVAVSALVQRGEVLDVNLPLERIVEKGVRAEQGKAGGLKVLELSARIVYVPVQTMTFRYGSTVISVMVEELQGKPISGRLPFRRSWAFLLGVGLLSVLGLLMGRFGRLMVGEALRGTLGHGGGEPLVNFLAVVSVILALVAGAGLHTAWFFFRTPFVYRITGRGGKLETPSRIPASPLNPFSRILKRMVAGMAQRDGLDGGEP